MNARILLALLLCWLTTAARAQTAPWTVVPLDDFGLEPDERARIIAAPVVPDLLEPLWDRTSLLTHAMNALGPPDEARPTESIWHFATAIVTYQEVRAITVVEVHPRRNPDAAITRSFAPQPGPLTPFFEAAAGTCSAAFARFGQPSFKENSYFAWTGVGRGRDVAVVLECGRRSKAEDVRSMRVMQLELPPAEYAALVSSSQATVKLPLRFTQLVGKARIADPRELWPRGFVPGQSIERTLELVGTPTLAFDSNGLTDLRWGVVVSAQVGDGRLSKVTLPAQGRPTYARLGITSPLIPLLAQPVAGLTDLLGQPIVRGGSHTWRWMASGHELAIEAKLEEGLVASLEFRWTPPPQPTSLPCAPLLTSAPSRAPKPLEYRSRTKVLMTSQLVPFKLWFGANQRDVVDRLGTPLECDEAGKVMRFPGVDVSFDNGIVSSISVDTDFLSPELSASKDPIVALIRKGGAALNTHLGQAVRPTPAGWLRGAEFEYTHGPQRIVVSIDLSDPDGQQVVRAYRLRMKTGFDYDLVTGLRLDALPTTGRAAFGLAPVKVPNTLYDDPLILVVADKPALKKKVGGKLIDLLGAEWTAVTTTLGEPARTVISGDRLFLVWAPDDEDDRKFAFVCSGTTPVCNEVHFGGARE